MWSARSFFLVCSILDNRKEGIIINDINIKSIRYANDTIFLLTSTEDLENIKIVLRKMSRDVDFNTNKNKSK